MKVLQRVTDDVLREPAPQTYNSDLPEDTPQASSHLGLAVAYLKYSVQLRQTSRIFLSDS